MGGKRKEVPGWEGKERRCPGGREKKGGSRVGGKRRCPDGREKKGDENQVETVANGQKEQEKLENSREMTENETCDNIGKHWKKVQKRERW